MGRFDLDRLPVSEQPSPRRSQGFTAATWRVAEHGRCSTSLRVDQINPSLTRATTTITVPPATHPSWVEVLMGRSDHKPDTLGARMLVVRSRLELFRLGNSPEAVRKFASELREFFAQNTENPTVQRDLSRMFG